MSLFQYNSDKLDRRGFISKESILSLVTQEDIFELVFKYKPQEFEYVVSPLRNDDVPGCWFSLHDNGILYFVDFGNSRTHSDCFNIVQDYFKFPNFYLTLEFIYSTLIRGKEEELKPAPIKVEVKKETKKRVKLLIEARPFNAHDGHFWSQYGISKKNLIEDKVFPISRLYALNTKTGSHVIECKDLAYSYTDFSDSRKKIYFPLRKGKSRFITNCTKDDVGGINTISPYCKQLIITKSYKDYRVLKNSGKHVIWFQNEGMVPNDLIINKLVKLNEIIVWFDNDHAGITASEKIKQQLNSIVPGKAKNLWLPERGLELGIKDPSDCKAKDPYYYEQFLKTFLK
jgi:hypothetical protein